MAGQAEPADRLRRWGFHREREVGEVSVTSHIEEANRAGAAQALRRSASSSTVSDKPFAILRYAKLKTTGAIRGSGSHMMRTIPTPNADAARTNGNVILVGSNKPAEDVLALVPEMGKRKDEDGPLLRRKNSVIAVEVLMTTSPEWWRDASQEDRDRWTRQSAAWLAEEWGPENVAHLQLHTDETTGHLTGMIVPIDPESGGLNARRWIGGRASKMEPGQSRISGHQTRYAQAVEDLGLRRGRIGSTAKHETIASYYRRAGAMLDELSPPPIPQPPLFRRKAWAARLQEQVVEAFAQQAVRAAEAATERRKAAAAGADKDRAQEALEAAREARQALAAEMRAIPLDQVLGELGAEWDEADKRWKIGESGARDHRIEVTDQKWRCAVLQRGGGGAIDLVKAVQGGDFNDALAWLSARFGTEATASDLTARTRAKATARVEHAAATRAPFVPPAADPDAWPEVRRHLTEERGLDPDLLDDAHEAGNVYAQSREGPRGGTLVNAIFLARDENGRPTGAEIKGIRTRRDGSRWSGMASGSDKRAGAFRAGVQRVAEAARVVVVESAIDALSALGWIRRERGYDGPVAVVSTAGDGSIPEPIMSAIPDSAKRFAGQDRNRAGDRQAKALGEGWKRLTPPEPHEDWNDWARAAAHRTDDGDQSQITAEGCETSQPGPAPEP